MSFEVHVPSLRTAAQHFDTLGTTVDYARTPVEYYMEVDGVGGILSRVAGELDGVRDNLMTAYGPGGAAENCLTGTGTRLGGLATDYQGTDAQQAAEYDSKLAEVEAPSIPWYPEEDLKLDEFGYMMLQCTLPQGAFESWDEFQGIGDKVEYLIGFDWIGDILGGIGLPNPLASFKEEFDGDWTQLGDALGALDMVVGYWRDVATDIVGIRSRLAPSWSGNAASSAYVYMDQLGDDLRDHADGLAGCVQRLSAEAMTIDGFLEELCDLVDTIVGLLPDPSDLGDLLGLLGSVGKAASKLLGIIELAKTAFDLALAAGMGIVTAFAQLTRFKDTDFPELAQYTPPDVDGPA